MSSFLRSNIPVRAAVGFVLALTAIGGRSGGLRMSLKNLRCLFRLLSESHFSTLFLTQCRASGQPVNTVSLIAFEDSLDSKASGHREK
jgi:hypothetical protein